MSSLVRFLLAAECPALHVIRQHTLVVLEVGMFSCRVADMLIHPQEIVWLPEGKQVIRGAKDGFGVRPEHGIGQGHSWKKRICTGRRIESALDCQRNWKARLHAPSSFNPVPGAFPSYQ